MARKRRSVQAFGLSFLDVICCGFGAVILIYIYLTAQTALAEQDRSAELRAEVNRIAEEVLVGRRNLVRLRNELRETVSDTASAESAIRQMLAELEKRQVDKSTYDATSLAQRARIEQLMTDIKALEEGNKRLEGGSRDRAPLGQDVRAFRETGGNRRYITGIRMRGSRVAIMVDSSASMLHQDLVTILRMRNMSDSARRGAAKWRRAVDTVNFLTTQLPPTSRYQIITFNESARPLLAGSSGTWHATSDADTMAKNLTALQAVVPEKGTSLSKAFIEVRKLRPAPDQIVLITDGLPTLGSGPPRFKYINAHARARLFDESIALIPDKVPVDVVLLPLEGELPAAHRYWGLARITQGVFLMPSKDWP
jgi:hypothetical protein